MGGGVATLCRRGVNPQAAGHGSDTQDSEWTTYKIVHSFVPYRGAFTCERGSL